MPLSKNSRCSRTMQFMTLIIVRRRCSIVWMSHFAEASLPWMYSRVCFSSSWRPACCFSRITLS